MRWAASVRTWLIDFVLSLPPRYSLNRVHASSIRSTDRRSCPRDQRYIRWWETEQRDLQLLHEEAAVIYPLHPTLSAERES